MRKTFVCISQPKTATEGRLAMAHCARGTLLRRGGIGRSQLMLELRWAADLRFRGAWTFIRHPRGRGRVTERRSSDL
jgi:hypothetical protein